MLPWNCTDVACKDSSILTIDHLFLWLLGAELFSWDVSDLNLPEGTCWNCGSRRWGQEVVVVNFHERLNPVIDWCSICMDMCTTKKMRQNHKDQEPQLVECLTITQSNPWQYQLQSIHPQTFLSYPHYRAQLFDHQITKTIRVWRKRNMLYKGVDRYITW
jgi:hypothetical protein